MGYYNMLCLNTQQAYSCALSLQLEGGHRSLNEPIASHWKPLAQLGLEESFLNLTLLPFPQQRPLYLLPPAIHSQAGTCKFYRFYRVALAWKFTNFVPKSARGWCLGISLQSAHGTTRLQHRRHQTTSSHNTQSNQNVKKY